MLLLSQKLYEAEFITTYLTHLFAKRRYRPWIMKVIVNLWAALKSDAGLRIVISGKWKKKDSRTSTRFLLTGEIARQDYYSYADYYTTTCISTFGSYGIKVWISRYTKIKK
jgi:ribosomal protein S3